MRDSRRSDGGIRRYPAVRYTALVPNLKGAESAIHAGVEAVRVVICLSESYNRRNVGLGISESLENCRRIRRIDRAPENWLRSYSGFVFWLPT